MVILWVKRRRPGCAVRKAIEEGKLFSKRWESYLKKKSGVEFVEDKSQFRKNKDARNRPLAVQYRRKKKEKADKQ